MNTVQALFWFMGAIDTVVWWGAGMLALWVLLLLLLWLRYKSGDER